MELTPLPAFNDNYIWMMRVGSRAWVVDPGQAEPVLLALARDGLVLEGILITHHHGDHTGGVSALRQATGAAVHGPAGEDLPEPCLRLHAGDTVEVMGTSLAVMDVPGHTAGHIAFLGQPEQQAPLVFCGDTLFSAGCGRLFEGTAAQMHASLSALAALPDDTRVCCAHEYTLSNLAFAATVEPNNSEITQHTVRCRAWRQEQLPTLPSTLGLEKRINPFLRAHLPSVRAAAMGYDAGTSDNPVSVFSTLRQWKNAF
ncbi:GloB Zn-dependent hydrolases, including glyoxylases [Burkholderiaceae bacterium]